MTFDQAFQLKFDSNNREAAKWLASVCKKHPEIILPSKRVTVDSLATKIGNLRRRVDLVWWQNRPLLLQTLAARLEVPSEDLLVPSRAGDWSLEFPEFPSLEPLGRGELPCPTWGSSWLGDIAVGGIGPVGERRWVVAPAGWGKSLLVRILRARHASEFVAFSAPTLATVEPVASPGKAFVVEIEGRSLEDAKEARRLADRPGSIVVLAPYEPPPLDGGWKVVAVPTSTEWRPRMIDWIDTRLDPASVRGTGFSPETMVEWLARRDPLGEAVASPGDLLAFCAELDRSGEPSGWGTCASMWLDRYAARRGEGAAHAWGSSAGSRAFKSMLRRQLDEVGVVPGAASREEWALLLDPAATPAGESGAPGSLVAIGHLCEMGLLRGGPAGLEPYPRWVRRGTLFDSLTHDLRSGSPSEWGALAADEARQDFVDGGLDELEPEEFRSVVRRVAAGKPGTLALAGATEATFAAAARRLRTPGFELPAEDVRVWQQLAALQVGTLVPHPACAGLHQPFTRRRVEEWLLNAWGYSFRVAPPRRLPERRFEWELPGWFDTLDPTRGTSLPSPRKFREMDRDLAELLHRMAARVAPTKPVHGGLALLIPALLATATSEQWKLGGTHLDLLRTSWEATALDCVLDRVPTEAWPATAERVWHLSREAMTLRGWSSFTVGDRIAFLGRDHSGLAGKVLAHLPWAAVEATIDSDGLLPTSDPVETLASLPRAVLHQALSAWLRRPPERQTKWIEARELAALLRPGDMSMLAALIRRADRDTAAELCKEVWRLAPDLARTESGYALEKVLPSAEGWFLVAPRAEIPGLAAQLERLRQLPSWVGAWAFHRALEAGSARERLFIWASD